jgi:hypothetical protein
MKFVSMQQVTPEHALLKWQVRGFWGVSDHSEDNRMSVQSKKTIFATWTGSLWAETIYRDREITVYCIPVGFCLWYVLKLFDDED